MPSERPEPLGFPKCRRCPYVAAGDWVTCHACVTSHNPLPSPRRRCPTCCHPVEPGAACGNPVCNWEDRSIRRVHAISLKTGAIDRTVRALKYPPGTTGWAVIFGRLVLGWLEANVTREQYGLVTINPTEPDRTPTRHTEAILSAAWDDDVFGEWPLDDPSDTVLTKIRATTASATGNWHQKHAAAEELSGALRAVHPDRIHGRDVLVIDDVTTTLLQLNAVAGVLRAAGARNVDGLVIARAIRRGSS